MRLCVIHCKQASLELQINAPARFTSTPFGTIPPPLNHGLPPFFFFLFFLTPFPTPSGASTTLSLSAPSLYWVVCLPTGLQSQTALVPGHWAKASLDRMRRKDSRRGGRMEQTQGKCTGATTLGVDSDLWACFLQQVAASLISADDAC